MIMEILQTLIRITKALIELASTPGGALLLLVMGMRIASARLARR